MITEHPLGRLGATRLGPDRCRFLVWAPKSSSVEVRIVAPSPRTARLQPAAEGYFHGILEGVQPGARYLYRLDSGRERPDPVSRSQPEGVHGPSEVVNLDFPWEDHGWTGLPITDYLLYEIHPAAFSSEGTFDGVIPYLDGLKDLGVTAIELMPVAQFPGSRNWGYDGVYPFAAQNTYGGPDGLRRLVQACHGRGMAVALDVVYNHLGPEGNYLDEFGHYFTDRYRTPWGQAINFDGHDSDHVVRYFVENALGWIRDFHIDMLRLDAVHAIFDVSARPFLRELSEAVHREAERLGRRAYLFAESNQNDTRHVQPREHGGFGLDGLWNEDFHRSVQSLLTGERNGYYQDFGSIEHLGRAMRDGFVFTGEYSKYRGRRQGVSSAGVPATRFIVYSQNHDQVGNRLYSERLSRLVSFEKLKLAAGAVLLSPYVPLLFMGEEYGETAPFPYFVDHGDAALNEAVWRGRQAEFTRFQWQGQVQNPKEEATFRQAMLNRKLADEPQHRELLEFYRRLIRLRKTVPALSLLSKDHREVYWNEARGVLACHRWCAGSEVCAVFHFGEEPSAVAVPAPMGRWRSILRSAREGGKAGEERATVESSGELTLELPATSLIVLERVFDDRATERGET